MEDGETGAWAVEFVISRNEEPAIEYAGPRALGPYGYSVIDWDDRFVVTIDVRADSAERAESKATALYHRLRKVAKLEADPDPQRGMTMIIAGELHPADLFILEAEELADQQRFELAVIAAQTHCEMWISREVRAVASTRGLGALIDGQANWSLMGGHAPRVFEALLGVRPNSAECWIDYKEHVQRRNRCVHQGTKVTAEGAQQSIDAAVAMVRFVSNTAHAVLESLELNAPPE
jgi:hypothetical protein